MKYFKLFEQFIDKVPYKLEEAVPGRASAKGFMGDPVKTVEELEDEGLYWFPVPSGAGYDVPTLGCLGLTGTTEDDGSPTKWTEFTSSDWPDHYPDEIHGLANLSKDSRSDQARNGRYHGLDGLDGEDESGWLSYNEMKALVDSGKVLKYVQDPNWHGYRAGKHYGI